MIAFLSVVSPSTGVVGAAALYVSVGAGVAVALRRRNVEPATVWSALAVWPLLVPLLTGGADLRGPSGAGPLGARIGSTFAAMERALAHPAAGDPSWRADLEALRRSLGTADERVGMVDRLLAEAGEPVDPETRASVDTLRRARDHAAAEIEEVLAGVERLRLQIGLLALAGEGARIGDHLRQLRSRVSALDEVQRVR